MRVHHPLLRGAVRVLRRLAKAVVPPVVGGPPERASLGGGATEHACRRGPGKGRGGSGASSLVAQPGRAEGERDGAGGVVRAVGVVAVVRQVVCDDGALPGDDEGEQPPGEQCWRDAAAEVLGLVPHR